MKKRGTITGQGITSFPGIILIIVVIVIFLILVGLISFGSEKPNDPRIEYQSSSYDFLENFEFIDQEDLGEDFLETKVVVDGKEMNVSEAIDQMTGVENEEAREIGRVVLRKFEEKYFCEGWNRMVLDYYDINVVGDLEDREFKFSFDSQGNIRTSGARKKIEEPKEGGFRELFYSFKKDSDGTISGAGEAILYIKGDVRC